MLLIRIKVCPRLCVSGNVTAAVSGHGSGHTALNLCVCVCVCLCVYDCEFDGYDAFESNNPRSSFSTIAYSYLSRYLSVHVSVLIACLIDSRATRFTTFTVSQDSRGSVTS